MPQLSFALAFGPPRAQGPAPIGCGVKERLRVRGELIATNILNHPNYDDPTLNMSQAGNVGVISGVGGSSNVSGASTPLHPSFILTADKTRYSKNKIF